MNKLFEPIRIKDLELKNRIVMAPMETGFETKKGVVSERLKVFYVERAKGGAGMIITGAASVHPDNSPKLSIYSDEYTPGLKELVKTIHVHGAKVAVQLSHGGRKIEPKSISAYPVAASSIQSPGRAMPRTLTIEEIEGFEGRFAEAARRAKDAGYDAVQLQAAHGYLIWTFLSPISNKRTDRYGGNLEDRMRFLLEIIERTQESVGDNFPIMVRINGTDYLNGGLTITDAKTIARKLEGAGVDSISVSAGETSSLCEYLVPPRAVPRGCHVPLANEIKKVVEIPVSVASRIDGPELAERILREGKADMIEMARPLLADPELPKKTAEGRVDEIRRCIACIHCEDRLNVGLNVECAINALAGREWRYGIKPSKEVKRILVIGGGPAGMEAARVAKLRCHEVILCEKANELGGQARLSAVPPYKEELRDLIKYYEATLKKLDIKIKLGQEVTPNIVKEVKPDVIIMATGAVPLIPKIRGIELENVITANEILEGKAKVGERVVIIGGGLVGCETADLLTERGKKVTIVEMLKDLGMLLEKIKGWNEKLLLQRLSEKNVKIFIKTRAEEITREGVIVRRKGEREKIEADTVVLAVGAKSNRELLNELKEKISIYEIGDCVKPRKLYTAIHEGFMIARKI